MEFAQRLTTLFTRAINNDSVIDACLMGSFTVLCVRSYKQQKDIEGLEAEKASLLTINKAMKKTLWTWKQQLYAEAESDSALVPLDRIKAIYGEANAPPTDVATTGEAVQGDPKKAAPKFIV
ncbi:hypothetical protein ACFE04_015879 [Oxalis oulophora]